MASTPFGEFMKQTKPGPKHRCPTCKTFGLRRYAEPGSEEKVICTNGRCADSPFRKTE